MERYLVIASGVIFSTSLFVLADGLAMARGKSLNYDFMMWMPLILSLCAAMLLFLVDPQHVLADEVDGEDEVQKSKIVFFISALMSFASVAIAVWKMINPFIDQGCPWPGAALVVQSILGTLSGCIIFVCRHQRDADD